MRRDFPCPETEEACQRGGCTLHNCQLERDAARKVGQASLSPEEEEIRRAAIPIAVEIARNGLRKGGWDKNAEMVKLWSKSPRVVAAARQQARRERDELRNLKIEI